MNLFKRINNIWKLGEYKGFMPQGERESHVMLDLVQRQTPELINLAQIIKRKPVEEIEEVLKDNSLEKNDE